jgi:excisionase family DNA binding protein
VSGVVYYYCMLTVPEVAARVGRDPETVRRWIRSGRLRARKVGTQHVVDEGDLAGLLGGDRLPVPAGWRRTSTGEPMPDVVGAVRRSRAGR